MASDGNSTPRRLSGGCLCGAVQYSVTDAFLYAANCHCSLCRRATGSAFKPFAGIGSDQFTLTSGADRLLVYGGEAAHDLHCAACGSLLCSVLDDGKRVHLTLGTLHDAPSIRPTAHIFVGSKAAWHIIADDLPQYERFETG